MSATSPLPRGRAALVALPIRASGVAPRLGRQLQRLGVDESTLRTTSGRDPVAIPPAAVATLLAAIAVVLLVLLVVLGLLVLR